MVKSKKDAIDYVVKNCYNSVTADQVRDVLELLEKFGMQPPLSHEQGVIEYGVSFKLPVYKWRDDG
jgi:hypothetical protein